MKKHLKEFRDRIASEYHFGYDFINKCKPLGPVKQKIINYMMSDYDMNGIVRWTREKYAADTGSSYNAVRQCFEMLIRNGVLTPLEGTSNYRFDFHRLHKNCKFNEWNFKPVKPVKPVEAVSDLDTGLGFDYDELTFSSSNTDIECRNTDIESRKTDIESRKTATQCQHTDNKDLTYSKDLYREEQDSSSPIKGEESRPSTTTTTTKPPITEEAIESLLQEISLEDEREKLFGK